AVEGNAITLGVGSLGMMESAGRELAAMALEFAPFHALVLCGRGRNGGDGMVAARYLQHIATDVIHASDGPLAPETELQLRALAGSVVTSHQVRCASDVDALAPLFTGADVIIDALLGTGGSGPTREPLSRCVALANASPAPVIAADLPTPGMRATRILSFHRAKVEGAEVADIGIPLAAEIFMGPGDITLVPRRGAKARKGENGEVLIIGGGPYQGAPYLAGLGALRAGADIVRIVSPVFEPVPDLIYERLEGDRITTDHLERILKLVERADVVVVGNGLGAGSHDVVLAVAQAAKKAVFDADALRTPLPVSKESVYTPHAGEFQRMTGNPPPEGMAARGRAAREAVRNMVAGRKMADGGPVIGQKPAAPVLPEVGHPDGCPVILLKGPVDVISDGTRVRFNPTGSPAMAVAGTGDVLAGVTGALLCRLPAFEAACIAAYVNGSAGMIAAQERGDGMTAGDLVEKIPAVLFAGGGRHA
ncbi:MAG TPA: NAD(P)H-hydrate dehydratase, partial [Methanomicrobiales archaeon]|nr:NAD(P)H-hydrate dehydratase [Methanomicrobiales archaeon]